MTPRYIPYLEPVGQKPGYTYLRWGGGRWDPDIHIMILAWGGGGPDMHIMIHEGGGPDMHIMIHEGGGGPGHTHNDTCYINF